MLTPMFFMAKIIHVVNLHSYSPVGDITVTSLCWLLIFLLMQTQIHKDRNFRMMIAMLGMTFISSFSGIFYQILIAAGTVHIFAIYIFRILRQVTMILLLFLDIRYMQEPLWIRTDAQKRYTFLTFLLLGASVAFDILGTIFHFTFYVDGDGTVHNLFNIYFILHILLTISIFYLIFKYRWRVIKQVFWGLTGAFALACVILIVQGIMRQNSFTGFAYFLPILSIFFMFHSNPFDINTGAASDSYLYHSLDSAREKKQALILISCFMMNFTQAITDSKDLRYEYYQFFRTHVRRGIVYHLENDRLVLTFPVKNEKDPDGTVQKMLDDFTDSYKKFEIDFKIVVMKTNPEVNSGIDYIRIIEAVERNMPFNTFHHADENDIKRFYGSSYILGELEDISQRRDLDDERILVYCQPVFNIRTQTYDTAEALMRLRLPQTGMVFPDQFIPIAEQYGHIHALSMIILNKTCGAIRTLIEDGYDINRISVNFSTLDIRYDSFCKEVQQIIARNQIPYSKIAIEITESRSEADFNIMKAKVQELQKLGIKFYLDDFGTGYSNFERIMEIPFDIIKFDRSMTIESAKNESSFYMVSTFANMFSKLHYSVLFEGIEDENDEENCVKMSAKYLQGYKYSKPIPIEELANFLEKTS